MDFKELRRKAEAKRWCREHPDIDLYQDRTGCASAGVAVMVAVVLLLVGCKTKYVPVVEVHEQHHWHTDSIRHTDSTYHEKETVVMQLDSAEMSKYGIRLQAAERAWLVRTAELERQLQHLERMTADRDTIHDSIPVPYPVEVVKEVPAPLTWWQNVRIGFANVALFAAVLLLLVAFVKSKIK